MTLVVATGGDSLSLWFLRHPLPPVPPFFSVIPSLILGQASPVPTEPTEAKFLLMTLAYSLDLIDPDSLVFFFFLLLLFT